MLLAAGPAFAHAVARQHEPGAGCRAHETPPAIVLTFTEPVTVSLGGVRLFDEGGERIATEAPTRPDNSTVSAGVRGRLADGSYVVTWRVNSSDSHPIQGAFTFQIGTAGNATGRDVTGLADELLAEQQGTRVVGAAWGVTRWLAFLGIALLVGSVVFCVAIWARARTFVRTRRIAFTGWGLLTVATIAGFVLQGPYVSGLGLSHVVDPGLWGMSPVRGSARSGWGAWRSLPRCSRSSSSCSGSAMTKFPRGRPPGGSCSRPCVGS